MMQGDLTDPKYFDFISFAQYAVINDQMKKGAFVFNEDQGVDGDIAKGVISVTVRRDPSVTNDLLPGLHSQMVGDRILQWIVDRYNIQKDETKEGGVDKTCCAVQLAPRPSLSFVYTNL